MRPSTIGELLAKRSGAQWVADGGLPGHERPPYPVAHRQVLSSLAVDGIRPGAAVPVRVNPLDPESILLV
jgi:hypothetical protein